MFRPVYGRALCRGRRPVLKRIRNCTKNRRPAARPALRCYLTVTLIVLHVPGMVLCRSSPSCSDSLCLPGVNWRVELGLAIAEMDPGRRALDDGLARPADSSARSRRDSARFRDGPSSRRPAARQRSRCPRSRTSCAGGWSPSRRSSARRKTREACSPAAFLGLGRCHDAKARDDHHHQQRELLPDLHTRVSFRRHCNEASSRTCRVTMTAIDVRIFVTRRPPCGR